MKTDSLKGEVSSNARRLRIYSQIKIDEEEHRVQPLRVHDLLKDFEIEDVWRLPVTLDSSHSLQLFMDQFTKSNAALVNRGLPGLLFKLRLSVGRWLKWDEDCERGHLVPGTIRFRYAKDENLKYEDLPDPHTGSFIPVYKLENEFLSEIENSTVHAALHLSRVPSGKDTWTIHMAVYVKPKGLLGRLYMLLIKPFRLWIVYPAMMKTAGKRWENYLQSIARH